MPSASEQIASFWHGGGLPPHCWLSLTSFVDHGHAVTLYSYDEMRVPPGVKNADAAEILPKSAIFYQNGGHIVGSISAFTDLFRFKLLLERGGWWVDTDVLCLRPDLPDQPVAFGWESNDRVIGTAALKLPRQHWFAERLYASALDIVRSRGGGAEVRWAEIGPVLLTRLVRECGLAASVEPQRRFFPLGWRDYQLVVLPEEHEAILARTRESAFVHLWSEMFRRQRLDPAAAPPGSWLAAMFARHGCDHQTGAAHQIVVPTGPAAAPPERPLPMEDRDAG
jgi:hypothetical protein